MKFYQITISVMFSIVYTSTLFGPDPVLPDIPEDIYNLVDEFCGGENKNREKELNDRYYEKTGYLKPYSRLHNLLMSLTMKQTKQELSRNFLQFTIFCTSFCTVIPILFFKIFSALHKTFPYKFLTAAIFSSFLALRVALDTDHIIAKIAKRLSHSHLHSHLTIKSPTKIAIWNNRKEIIVENITEDKIEIRSSSDMRLKNKLSSDMIPPEHYPYVNQKQKCHFLLSLCRSTNELLAYKLKNGKINIYLFNNGYSPLNKFFKSDYRSGDKLHRLSTPADVIAFDISFFFEAPTDENTIVALDKKGSLHKWELQNRPSLREIMNSDSK